MSSDIVIDVQGVSKSYGVYASPGRRMAALLSRRFANDSHQFIALKPLSLQIRRGSFFGIIGQNGSGKSTLLQIIAGIVAPNTGTVHLKGRIAALLELGAGFNPEFTGRENARLNAEILGVSGADFDRLLPEIESFADIGEFIDRPVKTYSSGMFVRLAFAVQACVDPDVLIVDEALAVGDIFFRLKCYERLERLRKKGCTIILVTHGMEDVMHYCDQVLLLHHGEALYLGPAAEAINRYYALGHMPASATSSTQHHDGAVAADWDATGILERWPSAGWTTVELREQAGDGLVRCRRVLLSDHARGPRHALYQGDTLHLFVEFVATSGLETPVIGFVIRTDKGVIVNGRNTGQFDSPVPSRIRAGSLVRAHFEISMDLGAGEYVLDVGFATWSAELYAHRDSITMAELERTASRHCVLAGAASFSVVPRGGTGFLAQPFYGLCNLPSRGHVGVATLSESEKEASSA
ncbi:ABC transporter ATP-binding protein [Niveibacterium sp. SC-1]|uniref:ABC transporter ATP-binding protein n=1 Tax=Niveibacterium sp. SC-1 TaxID=3135646 RepID=UPI00311EBA46